MGKSWGEHRQWHDEDVEAEEELTARRRKAREKPSNQKVEDRPIDYIEKFNRGLT